MARRSNKQNDVAVKEVQSNKMAEMKMSERVTQADDGNCFDSTLLNNAVCGASALSYNAGRGVLVVAETPSQNLAQAIFNRFKQDSYLNIFYS